ncbi:MAG TPA: hypothetical protein VFB81_07640 [Myxococcales bacterium]|nr:hypothetical protein [Myxococcales bacterium]
MLASVVTQQLQELFRILELRQLVDGDDGREWLPPPGHHHPLVPADGAHGLAGLVLQLLGADGADPPRSGSGYLRHAQELLRRARDCKPLGETLPSASRGDRLVNMQVRERDYRYPR